MQLLPKELALKKKPFSSASRVFKNLLNFQKSWNYRLHVLIQVCQHVGFHERLCEAFGPSLASRVQNELGPFAGNMDSDSSDDADMMDEADHQKLLPQSMHIMGICHITHNAMWQVTTHMQYWSTFYAALKNLAALLSDADKMRRVVTVIERGPLAGGIQVFSSLPPKLHEKRWSVIRDFMQMAYPQFLLLQQSWSHEMLGSSKTRNADSDFEVQLLENTLQDPMFMAYWKMVEFVNDQIYTYSAWSEGCTCHEPVLIASDTSPAEKRHLMQADLGGNGLCCPLQNMRLPELVAIMMGFLPLKAKQDGTLSVTLAIEGLRASASVSEEQWAAILHDCHAALSELDLIVEVKLGYIKTLPWMLAGLAHHNQQIVQKIAAASIEVFDGLNASQQQLLPSFARRLLTPGRRLRREMQSLASAASLSSVSARLLRCMSKLRFPCLSERLIEAAHKDIKKPHGYNKFGLVSASVHLRCTGMLDRQFTLNPNFFQDLLSCMSTLQSMSKTSTWVAVAKVLHIDNHPNIKALSNTSEKVQSSKWLQMCTLVLYRCDTHSLFRSLSSVAASHEQRWGRLQGPVLKKLKAAEPVNLKELAALYLAEHLRRRISEGNVLGIHMQFRAICPLHGMSETERKSDNVACQDISF